MSDEIPDRLEHWMQGHGEPQKFSEESLFPGLAASLHAEAPHMEHLYDSTLVTRAADALRAGITSLIADLDAARAGGSIYTYGQIQDRLRRILEGENE